MAVYGVSKQTLSQFRYHWFWGIRAAPAVGEDLGEVALTLKLDEFKRKALEQSVERVAGFPAVARWLYWVFNIGNYRVNQYWLSSYWLFRIYEGEAMQADSILSNAAASVSLILSIPGYLIRACTRLSQAIRPGWFFQPRTIDPELEFGMGNEVLSRVPEAGSDTNILVGVGMLDNLACLGINVPVGSVLTQKSLKDAYRRRCLQVHPDRPGGSHALSVAVNRAYEQIMTRQSKMGSLIEQFQDIQDRIIQLRQEQQVTRELLAEEGRHLAAQDRRLAEQDRRLAEQDRRLAEQDRRLAAQDRRLDGQGVSLQELRELDRSNRETLDKIVHALYIVYCHRLRVFPLPVRLSAEELTRVVTAATGRTYRFFPALLPPEGVSGACVENALAVVTRRSCPSDPAMTSHRRSNVFKN